MTALPPQDAYAPLAPIYDDAGLSHYAATITPELLTLLQTSDWLGRRVLDLGCGTGASTAFFASRNLDVTGIDSSPAMLNVAKVRSQGTGFHAKFVEGDIATMDFPGGTDLVYCIGNVLNELKSLRDIETVFNKAYAALAPNKVFVFDMTTLYGLGEEIGTSQVVLDVSDRIFIAVENTFSYDNMALRQRLSLFTRSRGEMDWKRASCYLTLRGFPYITLARLVEKAGFTLTSTYDAHLNPVDPQTDTVGKWIVVAKRKG